MNWGIVTAEWRLKLLAIGLAVLMLAAVAFSQNPPTSGSVTVSVIYDTGQNNVVLINPPDKITVTYSGLSAVVKNVNAGNTVANVDATHARPGQAVRLPVSVSSISGVTVQQPPPILVQIDAKLGKDVQIQVNTRAAAGWSVNPAKTYAECKPKPDPCTVHFDGPASWETTMAALVSVPGQVSYTSSDIPNLPVQLQNANGVIDLTCKTRPCASLDVTAVTVHVEASQGSTVSSVPLLESPWSHGPANGYRVTAETITPNTVVITGDPVALGRVRNITLPPVDLTGKTSDATFQVAIPYPDGVTGNVANATVKYSISPNPNVSPGS